MYEYVWSAEALNDLREGNEIAMAECCELDQDLYILMLMF